jgi:hypothetical protein
MTSMRILAVTFVLLFQSIQGLTSNEIEVQSTAVEMTSLEGERTAVSCEHVVRMRYDSLVDSARVYTFYVCLHDPSMDQIISRGIKEGLFGPKDKYASVDELHSVCEYSVANCAPGRVFVEVGSAIGMVSLYAANRGMRVYAFDPILTNIQLLRQSTQLNGEQLCVEKRMMVRCVSDANDAVPNCSGDADAEDTIPYSKGQGNADAENQDAMPKNGAEDCTAEDWGPYSPVNFRLFWNLVGGEDDDIGQWVESEPENMAATMRGGGSYRAQVKMVTLDQAVGADTVIELMLLTCQGFEYDVSKAGEIDYEWGDRLTGVSFRRWSAPARCSQRSVFELSSGAAIT